MFPFFSLASLYLFDMLIINLFFVIVISQAKTKLLIQNIVQTVIFSVCICLHMVTFIRLENSHNLSPSMITVKVCLCETFGGIDEL